MSISVSIVEDDPQVRGSLAELIDSSSGLSCVSQHDCAETAIKEIPNIRPAVVLMDINLPGINGVECVRQLKPLLSEGEIVMLTAYENPSLIFSALAAGATGYLLKSGLPEDLIAAIHKVSSGGVPMSSHIARKVVAFFQDVNSPRQGYEKLSEREKQVLDYLTKGYRYNEIANDLQISYTTVHTHIRHIYDKLHVHSRAQVMAKHFGTQPLDLNSVRFQPA